MVSREIGFVYNKAKEQRIPYFIGEEEKILSFAGNPDLEVRIFADEELDELAYAVSVNSDIQVVGDKELFFATRKAARKEHANLLKKFGALAKKIREKTIVKREFSTPPMAKSPWSWIQTMMVCIRPRRHLMF